MTSQPDIVRRGTLADQIADLLLDQMRDDAMRPGDPLPPEKRLAETYSVSRPVVREALMKLKSLGLIKMSSGRPPTVQAVDGRLPSLFFERSVAMNLSDVRELLEVRRGLELQSAILAARHAGPGERSRLLSLADRMGKALSNRKFKAFVELDVKLHLLIAEASRNSILQTLVLTIREPMRKSIDSGLDARDSEVELSRIHDIHLNIVSAIDCGDETAATEAMARHFDEALSRIVNREGGDEF